MRRARILVHGEPAAVLEETEARARYRLTYLDRYDGPPVSPTLPVRTEPYAFAHFPAFFDGLLPEGPQLEGLLRIRKIDRQDRFAQLVAVGADVVGCVTIEALVEGGTVITMQLGQKPIPDSARMRKARTRPRASRDSAAPWSGSRTFRSRPRSCARRPHGARRRCRSRASNRS